MMRPNDHIRDGSKMALSMKGRLAGTGAGLWEWAGHAMTAAAGAGQLVEEGAVLHHLTLYNTSLHFSSSKYTTKTFTIQSYNGNCV